LRFFCLESFSKLTSFILFVYLHILTLVFSYSVFNVRCLFFPPTHTIYLLFDLLLGLFKTASIAVPLSYYFNLFCQVVFYKF
jgi:hypothetical protein